MVVCKRWYALISAPDFGNLYLQFNYTFTLLVSNKEYMGPMGPFGQMGRYQKLFWSSEDSIFRSNSFSLTYIPCEPKAEPPVVVTSCGDLLLCCPNFNYESYTDYYICNPLTAKWIQIPPSHVSINKRRGVGFICQGQGNSFKYAIVVLKTVGNSLIIHNFTSDSEIWSEKKEDGCFENHVFYFTKIVGLPYEGTLFWITATNYELLSLDPFHEGGSVRVIALPRGPAPDLGAFRRKNFNFRPALLGICRGNLRLVEYMSNIEEGVLFISVWDLKRFDEKEWYLKHIKHFPRLISQIPTWKSGGVINPIACDPRNGAIVYFMVKGKILLSYNMDTETFEVIHEFLDTEVLFDNDFLIYELPWQPSSIPSLRS